MCPKMSGAASSRVAQARVCTRFDFTMPMSDSMAALSHGEDIEPIEGRMPCTRMVLESSGDTYCEPNPPSRGRLAREEMHFEAQSHANGRTER